MATPELFDDIMATNPVCPHCGEDRVRAFTRRLICNDCQTSEAVTRQPDDSEAGFATRLSEMAARWRTTPERIEARIGTNTTSEPLPPPT